jgi:hypothetical protein
MSHEAAITIALVREPVERRRRSSAPPIDGDVTSAGSEPTGYRDDHADVDAVRRAHTEDPRGTISNGTRAVRPALAAA